MLIDLNCDLGEGSGSDAEVLPLVTTANVACGFHAGDPATAFATVLQAANLGVRVGAHPGFQDREHFGRRELEQTELQVYEDCVYQIGALAGVARACGTSLSHIKAHGALYNMACREPRYAKAIVAAANVFGLPLLGLPGSLLEKLSAGQVPFFAEGFADRGYRPDGTLVPRSERSVRVRSREC